MKARIVVAMSGGVDSSVAAALLRGQGYEVIGITMCFNLTDSVRKKPICCGLQGIEDARRVAHKLGISHFVVNMQKQLEENVIKNFCREYLKGRTPNPCIRCNQFLKFDYLLKKAFSLDAKYLATGHYAKIQNYLLKKAKDRKKDQSYFLYRLTQGQLKHILFPLANYTKVEVRKLAREFALPVAEKLASQEICFLPDMDYRGFLKKRMNTEIEPGKVIDRKGKILGQHKGIAFYTIGQREGLGIAAGYPLYINKLEPKNNTITVGRKEEAFHKEFLVKEPHFISRRLKKRIALKVKIRYNHREALAEVIPTKNKIRVRFKKPQFAITPGQSAVFYDKDTVLGGGIIDEVQ
ncbi:MAG: tRNA 2-thiouridine(34) synthase MnmA [Omnitrophica WOR_2 bacterium RIFCSPLOWO2_01_FULL_41_12]|nr:MAG: tRNA 2-thiouridine(34) synthase MnmA [Omnitrophica WOR_2 bacterium RIFCSPLOWO2_01_FULL_41_12]